jgi:antitoxin component YwqK of YwqJK toxin-antitoxin module
MKTLLFVFTTLLCGCFFSQERVKASECDDIQGLRVLKSTGKPYTGIVYENYDSGELNYEKNHVDGKRIGWQKHYSKEGKILGEVNLIDGNGILRVNHENGKPFFEVNYQNGLSNGLYRIWDENGQLTVESNYQNGMLNGNDKWFKNGILRENCIYKDGEKITCKNYNESGLLDTEDFYGLKQYHNDNGKLIKEFLIGVTKEYNENGVVINEYPINSVSKSYNEKGILIKEDKGGSEIEYNDNGLKISEIDHIDGSEKTWYDSGQLKSTSEYNNEDIRTDKYYFENGKLKQEKKSKNKEVLFCKCYNKKGKEVECEK